MKLGDKVYSVNISASRGLSVDYCGSITHIVPHQEVWAHARMGVKYFFGHPDSRSIPIASVQYLPQPFMYCLEEDIEECKKQVIDIYNRAQQKRRFELQQLLDTCNEIPAVVVKEGASNE